jgi:hypothetical protein
MTNKKSKCNDNSNGKCNDNSKCNSNSNSNSNSNRFYVDVGFSSRRLISPTMTT